ncbi:MAG TPA: maleylpyruvate isomerase family mycothiol-dependent enzyme [Acidimicrobiales bacterium]|nr:maleylpyruvate isomerase family mycothiol-dependent enzyme [Acidimicrobiales bacterium]
MRRSAILENLRTVSLSFGAVAGRLTPAQWQAPSLCPAWTARGVVVHVTTVETALLGWRPGGDNPFAAMPAIAAELDGIGPDALLARYREVTADRLAELDAMTDEDFDAPSITPVGPGTYGRFMAIRQFDIWVHERDIRVPLGLAGDDDGPAADMALDEVEGSIGYIVGKKIGLPDGKSIAFELTGPVHRRLLAKVDGRASLVEELAAPDVTMSMDSLTFMLLACGRIDPDGPIGDGRLTWSGDPELAAHAAHHLAFTM